MLEPLHWMDPAQYHLVKDGYVTDDVATMCIHHVCIRVLKRVEWMSDGCAGKEAGHDDRAGPKQDHA